MASPFLEVLWGTLAQPQQYTPQINPLPQAPVPPPPEPGPLDDPEKQRQNIIRTLRGGAQGAAFVGPNGSVSGEYGDPYLRGTASGRFRQFVTRPSFQQMEYDMLASQGRPVTPIPRRGGGAPGISSDPNIDSLDQQIADYTAAIQQESQSPYEANRQNALQMQAILLGLQKEQRDYAIQKTEAEAKNTLAQAQAEAVSPLGQRTTLLSNLAPTNQLAAAIMASEAGAASSTQRLHAMLPDIFSSPTGEFVKPSVGDFLQRFSESGHPPVTKGTPDYAAIASVYPDVMRMSQAKAPALTQFAAPGLGYHLASWGSQHEQLRHLARQMLGMEASQDELNWAYKAMTGRNR